MKQYISTYALYHPNDAYLEHGLSWGKHRYIKRTGTPGNYKYTYAEDLKKAGASLVSGIRNVARKVGNSVGNFTGASQDRKVRLAESQQRSASNAVRNLRSAAIRNDVSIDRDYKNQEHTKKYSDAKTMRSVKKGRKLYESYYRAVDEERKAYENLLDARTEAYNAPLRKIMREIRDAPQNMVWSIQDAVNDFKRDKIGTGYRASIMKAKRNMDFEIDKYTGKIYNEYSYARYESQYRQACENYGKTLLGSMERILNTQFYKDILRRA